MYEIISIKTSNIRNFSINGSAKSSTYPIEGNWIAIGWPPCLVKVKPSRPIPLPHERSLRGVTFARTPEGEGLLSTRTIDWQEGHGSILQSKSSLLAACILPSIENRLSPQWLVPESRKEIQQSLSTLNFILYNRIMSNGTELH